MTITLKKRTQTWYFLVILIWLPFLFALMNEILSLPGAVRYVMDGAWGILLFYLLLFRYRGQQMLAVWVWLFLIYTLLAWLPQWQSPLYYLWGVRNNFRFYAAFFAFAAFLKVSDVDGCMKLFDKLFWLNAAVSVYQFFALSLDRDHLGGLFGTERGANGYTNLFFLIMVTKEILLYLDKHGTIGRCVAVCGIALVISAMAELKFFFVEFLIVIVLAVMLTNFTWRKLWIILGGLVGVTVCVTLLTSLFPVFEGFLSLDRLWASATSDRGYTHSGDLNRLTAIPQINELWLKSGWQRIFGLGLGNCDTSTYAMLNTPFYESYGKMHYMWISYAMIYLETGWIGLLFFWGFFVLVYFRIRRIEKHTEGIARSYCRISRIMAVMCFVVSFYNGSLRTEGGYMAYLILAVPFVIDRNRTRKVET